MSAKVDVSIALPLLEQEPLRHLVTLKMINGYGDGTNYIAFIDGTSFAASRPLTTELTGLERRTT